MTNYKQSLESKVLKARLNRLMESLEKTNTSKMILERYYSNICTLEISEGSSTSKEVQAELKSLGLNESKIISAVSSSVVPERKGVADHFAIQKIAILENICKELNPYSWMKSVSTFIAETEDFMRNNEISILLERIVFDLENDRNANYYKEAINTISEAAISENPVYFILENTKDQKWIPLVKRLYEYCETKKGSINGTNPNFVVSKIFSPIEFIEERGSYVFNANGKVFETDGDTIMEYAYPTSDKFKSLLAITEKAKFDNGVMRLYPNSTSTLDINFNEEKPKVFINNKLVESTSVESHLLVGGYVSYSEKEKIAQIQQAIHEGNNIKELDFGYTVNSRLYETVSVSVFSIGENVYIQKVNKGMNENTLTKAESAEDAISIVKDFMNYDISNSIKHLTEAEEAKNMSKEKEVSKQLDYLNSVYEKETETIRTRIKTLTESLMDLDRVARLNGVENTTKIVQAKSLLESQINKAKEALDEQESLIKSESKKLASLDEAKKNNFSNKDFPIGAKVHMEDGVFIVSKGPNGFGFDDEKSKIWLKPFDTKAKSKRSASAGSYTIDVLNKNVMKIEESTSLDEAKKNNFSNKDFPMGALVHTEDDGVFIVSKGPNGFGFNDEKSKIWLKPHDTEAKRHYKGVGEYTLDVLNKKVTKIEESTIEGNEAEVNEGKKEDLAVQLEAIFAQIKGMNLDKAAELTFAKAGIGFGFLDMLSKPGAIKKLQDKSPEGKQRIKDAHAALTDAKSTEEIKSILVGLIDTVSESVEVNESCVPGKEYKIAGNPGWIYQGVSDGNHIFNNEKGGFSPKNYNDEEFANAHSTGEITECGSM